MTEINALKKKIIRELEQSMDSLPFKDSEDKANALFRVLFTAISSGVAGFNSVESLIIELKDTVNDSKDLEFLISNTRFLEKYIDVVEEKTHDSFSRLRGEIFLAKKKIEELKTTLS